MYNRVPCAQKQRLVLKSYITGVYSLIGQRDIITIFYEKIVNELIYWMDKHPHVIQYSNVPESIFFKVNGTLVKKQNHPLQI